MTTDKLTPKQEKFALLYLETGNACEAYRRAYEADGMTSRTIEKRASELLQHGAVKGRIAALQGTVAEKAALSRAWVLERLMRNARIAMGEEKIKETIKPKKSDELPFDLEFYARDGAVANKALELLGKVDEVALFKEVHEHGLTSELATLMQALDGKTRGIPTAREPDQVPPVVEH